MEELICKNCGLCQSIAEANVIKKPLHNGGYHSIARCSDCNSFIKNIPHSRVAMLWFGKHKGKAISTVAREDKQYLQWLMTTDIKDKLKSAIKQELKTAEARKEYNAKEQMLFSRS